MKFLFGKHVRILQEEKPGDENQQVPEDEENDEEEEEEEEVHEDTQSFATAVDNESDLASESLNNLHLGHDDDGR